MMNEVTSIIPIIHDEYASQDVQPSLSPILILHALFDSKKNWKGVASALAAKTKRKVYVLDVPDQNDGDPPMDVSFDAVYKTAENFLEKLNETVILVGHSIGAVISIMLATRKAKLVSQLVLIDISPVDYPRNAEEKLIQALVAMRQAIAAVPKEISCQKAQSLIMKHLEKVIQLESVRKMLSANLIEGKNGLRWRLNLDSLEVEFKKNYVANLYPLKCLCYVETLLVYGEISDYVSENDFHEMKVVLPKLRLYCMKGSSHWIHLEQPDKLVEIISNFVGPKEESDGAI